MFLLILHLMQQLNFPPIQAKIKKEDEQFFIFDIIRKKNIFLTPEEWVRQHIIHFLISEKKYSKALISCEKGLKYNKLSKRSDIVVYDNTGKPYLLIECKAPSIKINQVVFEQASTYNQTLKAPYIAVSNGIKSYICKIDFENNKYVFLDEFPTSTQETK